ncbi:hypothetical protein [Natrinema salaciae]|uniref:Uncharacterized protein n=1 Tax=Natrinema salaciae TaxID=1186196 RepID=A0A1H9IJ20_9EURY|nr:hypothetical protein [Natrinema salaciae]SEQ74584.1 hypothetical protein SAMN04489841_2248 [Natrinema salaciae]
MAIPYRGPGQYPTESDREDAATTKWGLREGIGLSIASIFGLLLLVVGLMLASGLVAAASTDAVTAAVTIGFLLFAVVLLVVGRWSWNGR